MWFGSANRAYSEQRFRNDLACVGVVAKAGVKDWALQAPGRASGLIGARCAVELMLEDDRLRDQPLTLLEDPAARRTSPSCSAASVRTAS
jgi:hypothetical protein